MQKACKAITKKKKPCPIGVDPWRTNGFCHVHDPNGKFRQQQKKKGYKNGPGQGNAKEEGQRRKREKNKGAKFFFF